MSEHVHYLKDNQGECGCGCGEYGTLKKPNRKGVRCVARKCKCASCRNRLNRKAGDEKGRRARKVLGLPGANTRHEELWGGGVRVEVKSGAQVRPAVTAYLRCEAQSEQARPIGDHRPFAAVLMPQGTKDGLVVVRLSNVHEFAAALVEQWEAS